MLGSSGAQLADQHDLFMFDLDGVVYIGGDAVPGVAGHVEELRARGKHIAFVTNNASRTPSAVAEKLQGMGVGAQEADVVTSAQAAARVLADRFGQGARVLLLGGSGLERALEDAGLLPTGDPQDVVALVSGYGPDVRWRDIMRAATLVRAGLPYVASNADLTIPTPEGLGPGHGVLVRVISDFAGVVPVVAGKPERPLMDETVLRIGGEVPLMVGDRLDTDIEGANEVGVDSLLVMTGVTRLPDLASAPPRQRPTYVSPDTSGLFEQHRAPRRDGADWVADGCHARVVDGRLEVAGDGDAGAWWRAACCALWEHLDAGHDPADTSGVTPPASRPAE